MEDDSAFAYKNKKPASSVVCTFLFSHLGLFFLVLVYTAVGAMIFINLEQGAEQKRYEKKMAKARSINQSMNYLVQKMWFYEGQNYPFENFSFYVHKDLQLLEDQIMAAIENNDYDGTVEGWEWSWTFAKSTLLTMTIITTIGYGHISPSTFYGQMYCIVYALVGCPLLLLFLANIGEAMADTLTYFYSRCCCRWCRARRNVSELPPGAPEKHARQLIDEEVGEEEYMPTNEVTVPIIINLVLLASYIILGAYLFSTWENWPFYTSCYFTFVTVSTIGYGDYYPETAMVNDLSASFVETAKMFFCVLYLLFGMALLSMSVNLMQDQLMEKCRWFARWIGLSKDPNAENDDDDPKDPKNDEEPKDSKLGAAAQASPSKENDRRESVAGLSVPEAPGQTSSSAPTRPASAMSILPGAAE
ncbi:Potassium channel domain [Trinorchestia longiramus]|nr:Potassium channel domain [Trinorchestia longiramus]